MTLQIEQKETDNRELKLTVQVEEKRVQDAIRSTARKLAKNLRIPGFRPGKAPFHIVERTVGKQALRAQAIDEITQDLYQEAIAQVGAIPHAPGSLDDMKLEPLVLDLTIPLTPTVDLGEYRLVREEPVEVSVEDKAVDEALARIQEKHALIEPADRPAAEGDLIIADVKGTQDGETMIDQEGAEMILDPEKLYPDTDFVKNVVGLSAGEQVSFDLNTSEEDEEPSMMTYDVKVNEVKSRYLPPLNDDLAKEEGDFESLLDLRIHTRDQLTQQAQSEADNRYVENVFDAIKEGASVVYPPAAIEMEIDQMAEDLDRRYKQQGWSLEDLLKLQSKSMEDYREELRPNAEQMVTNREITREIMVSERLSMDEGELERVVEERLGAMPDLEEDTANQLREMYTTGQGRAMMANDVLMAKYTERIRDIGLGNAPDLKELDDEEE